MVYGYQIYTSVDLERLQQVLFFRELGFSLREIREIVDSPSFDRSQALRSHRRLLVEKRERLDRLIQSVERTLDTMERGETMKASEMFEGFDTKQLEEWREEARERWGSEKVDESWRRASKYTKEDWAAIQAEGQLILDGMAARMDRDPADPEVQQLVHLHYRQINERYYDCSLEVYRGLGDLYVNDPRFTANYDKVKPGLAAFTRLAMRAYCDVREGK